MASKITCDKCGVVISGRKSLDTLVGPGCLQLRVPFKDDHIWIEIKSYTEDEEYAGSFSPMDLCIGCVVKLIEEKLDRGE